MKSVAAGKISVLGRSSFVLHRAYNTSLRARESATARAALCVALFLLIFVGGSVLFLVHTKGHQRAALSLTRKAGAGLGRSEVVHELLLPTAPRSASQQLAELLQADGGGKGQHQEGVGEAQTQRQEQQRQRR